MFAFVSYICFILSLVRYVSVAFLLQMFLFIFPVELTDREIFIENYSCIQSYFQVEVSFSHKYTTRYIFIYEHSKFKIMH